MNRTLCFFLLLTLTAGLAAVSQASAQSLVYLHSFGDGTVPSDGAMPSGPLVQGSDDDFYGTTMGGGAKNEGTIYKITPSGDVTILYSFEFPGESEPGTGVVEGNDGNFYGTTQSGGAANLGTVFETTPGGTVSTLFSFGGNTSVEDTAIYTAGLSLGSDGNIYGTTSNYDGTAADMNAVFKITPAGTVMLVHAFGTTEQLTTRVIQGRDGDFYGSFDFGGSAGDGASFKMTPSGTVTILHSFVNGNGGLSGLVQGTDGNFYGTTEYGGTSDDGTVFKVTPAGAYTLLYDFGTGNDGKYPNSSLIQGSDGNFYGTTYNGGAGSDGTVFRITPTGALTVFYDFGIQNNGSEADGLVQGNDGDFYGTISNGGTAGHGAIFRLNIPKLPLTSLSPSSTGVGGPTFTLTIAGANFTSATTVAFGGLPVTVTAQTATQLKVAIPASAITTIGSVTVTVGDPSNGTGILPFAVTPPWNARDVAVSDGTARLLWDRSDGAAGIWSMNTANAQTAVGPTYGPYQGWMAQDITAAADGTSRILWTRYDGATGVWALNPAGVETAVGPTYGPFTGWKATDLAAAPDGTSRLLWRYTNGEAGLLSLNAMGSQVISGRSYGPYPGWTATAVGASGDGTARILWTRSDGAMGIWTMDAGDLQKTVGPTYGPYSDSHGHWTATDLSTSADGSSCVLWKRSDGAVGVWTFSAANTAVTSGPVYGPYPGWTAAAMDAASDKARVLWVNTDRVAGLWSFGSNDVESLIGPIYGPY